ncbi:lysyl-tRNA synthetase, partial [Coemansia sp. RSA 921]
MADATAQNENLQQDPVTNEWVSKSELKRRIKQREKDAKKAAKQAANPAPAPKATKANAEKDEEELSPNQYFEIRNRAVDRMREEGPYPYPHKFHVDMSLTDYIEEFKGMKTDETKPDREIRLAGRIYSKRAAGTKLVFYDLHSEGKKIQILATAQYAERDFATVHDALRRGDIVGVRGFPCVSKSGELSISPRDITLLAPCLHSLPNEHYGLRDQETRYRQRYLDLIMNTTVRNKFITRSKIINYV